jgi:hypothetical protein
VRVVTGHHPVPVEPHAGCVLPQHRLQQVDTKAQRALVDVEGGIVVWRRVVGPDDDVGRGAATALHVGHEQAGVVTAGHFPEGLGGTAECGRGLAHRLGQLLVGDHGG